MVSGNALKGTSELCVHALDLFVGLYGAEAGNLALKGMATGGVYIGGGIAPRILAKLKEPMFMDAFRAKGRVSKVLEAIPVRVILNDKTALLGAGRVALLAEAEVMKKCLSHTKRTTLSFVSRTRKRLPMHAAIAFWNCWRPRSGSGVATLAVSWIDAPADV